MACLCRRIRAGGITAIFISVCILSGQATADDATRPAEKLPAAFYLLTKKDRTNVQAKMPILDRELYRQALLIAARDGLGLQTRDGSLREWQGSPPANVTWNFIPDLMHPDITTEAGRSIWEEGSQYFIDTPQQVFDQIVRIESLSEEGFVDLLKANGFSGTANVMMPGAAAPPDAETKLADFDELSQFAVLRETHKLIRNDGESEARLGVLVRGYANLGQLTRFHWSIEHQVFTARSLLYAQRMVAIDSKSAVALWHRAYAMAFAGWQGQALKDLAAGNDLATRGDVPAWAALLEPFCRYDHARLSSLAAANPSQAPLAMYLAFLTVEHSGCQSATINTEKAALELNPRCLRLIDAMCDLSGPGPLNQLAEEGPRVFSLALGSELEKMPGLPKDIVQKIQKVRRPGGNPEGRAIVGQMLIEAGTPQSDSMEPSWAALGRTIQETTFAHARRKADIIATWLDVDASGYVAQVRPFISEHPFTCVVDAYGAEHEKTFAHSAAALKALKWEDLTVSELPLYRLEAFVKSGDRTSDILNEFDLDMDYTSFDKETWLAFYGGELQRAYLNDTIEELRLAGPDSPWLICDAIINHWDLTKAKVWESSHAGEPMIEMALGKKYTELGQWNDAERCLKRYIGASPDIKGYEALAKVYKDQKLDDLWLATLNEYLKNGEDYGLQYAQVQVEIANYFIAKRDFKSALPYADAAVDTGAALGLQCAEKAHTGIGDFDRAERLCIEEYENYSGSPYSWYSWCLKTGHGHRADAAKAMHEYFKGRGTDISDEELLQRSLLDAAEGKPADAVPGLQERFTHAPGPLSLVHLMVFADEAGDIAARDDAIRKMRGVHSNSAALLGFAKALAKAYQAGPDASLDLKAIDSLAAGADAEDRILIYCLTARYLERRGHKDVATDYLKRCYFGFDDYCPDELLVDQGLQDAGIVPLTLINPATQPSK